MSQVTIPVGPPNQLSAGLQGAAQGGGQGSGGALNFLAMLGQQREQARAQRAAQAQAQARQAGQSRMRGMDALSQGISSLGQNIGQAFEKAGDRKFQLQLQKQADDAGMARQMAGDQARMDQVKYRTDAETEIARAGRAQTRDIELTTIVANERKLEMVKNQRDRIQAIELLRGTPVTTELVNAEGRPTGETATSLEGGLYPMFVEARELGDTELADAIFHTIGPLTQGLLKGDDSPTLTPLRRQYAGLVGDMARQRLADQGMAPAEIEADVARFEAAFMGGNLTDPETGELTGEAATSRVAQDILYPRTKAKVPFTQALVHAMLFQSGQATKMGLRAHEADEALIRATQDRRFRIDQERGMVERLKAPAVMRPLAGDIYITSAKGIGPGGETDPVAAFKASLQANGQGAMVRGMNLIVAATDAARDFQKSPGAVQDRQAYQQALAEAGVTPGSRIYMGAALEFVTELRATLRTMEEGVLSESAVAQQLVPAGGATQEALIHRLSDPLIRAELMQAAGAYVGGEATEKDLVSFLIRQEARDWRRQTLAYCSQVIMMGTNLDSTISDEAELSFLDTVTEENLVRASQLAKAQGASDEELHLTAVEIVGQMIADRHFRQLNLLPIPEELPAAPVTAPGATGELPIPGMGTEMMAPATQSLGQPDLGLPMMPGPETFLQEEEFDVGALLDAGGGGLAPSEQYWTGGGRL